MKFTFFVSNIPKPIIITTDDQDRNEAQDIIQKAMSNSLVLCIENHAEFAIIRGSTINFVLGHSIIDVDESCNASNCKILEGVRISIPVEMNTEDSEVEVN